MRPLCARIIGPGSLISRRTGAYSTFRHISSRSVAERYDIVIAGGGVMGLSTAYFIKSMEPRSSVCVVERDPTYRFSSSTLSVSSIRQQFSAKENVQLSLWSVGFLKNISTFLSVPGEDPPDVQFFEGGYLFLGSEKGRSIQKMNYELQRSLGAKIEWLSKEQLKQRFPWLQLDGITQGTLGVQHEGWFDSWSLLSAFKKKAISLGVHYIEGTVVGMETDSNRINSVKVVTKDGTSAGLRCGYVVNGGGPWAADIASLAGIGCREQSDPIMHIPLPVRPYKRMVYVIHCPDGPEGVVPVTIDLSGLYLRSEGQGKERIYICGGINPEGDPDGMPLDVDYDFFDKEVWPVLADRIPAFQALKVKNAWAGYYEYNTFDQNAILGAHTVVTNLYFINGFSGHGIQQAPAAGRCLAEMILNGKSVTVDVSRMGFDRIIRNEQLLEENVV